MTDELNMPIEEQVAYTDDNIRHLSDMEHVRLRPGTQSHVLHVTQVAYVVVGIRYLFLNGHIQFVSHSVSSDFSLLFHLSGKGSYFLRENTYPNGEICKKHDYITICFMH